MPDQAPRPALGTRLAYRDVQAAAEWLVRAFGCEIARLASGPDGTVVHAEMRFGGAEFDLGGEFEHVRAPAAVGGANTQTTILRLTAGIHEHCERARAAGARIVQEPEEQFHGDILYRAIDPEGQMWMFLQHVRDVTNAEMEAAVPGMKVWTPERG